MRVTYKASILHYTVIDLILLGAHDGGTCGPDEGRQPTSRAASPWSRVATARGLAFALLRESYTWFYGRYGVIPEDVGISQIRMLTGVLRIFHLWSLPIPGRPAASFLLVLIGIWAYFVVGRWLLRRLRARSPRAEESTVLRYPLLFGISILMLLVVLTSAWVVPRDRDFAGKRLQLRQGVRPGQLSMLAIQADPVQVIWTAGSPEPRGLVNIRLVYLGHANGVMVLYDPPKWGTCDIDACRGVVWRVSESDAVIQVEVNPPDAHAPTISDPHLS